MDTNEPSSENATGKALLGCGCLMLVPAALLAGLGWLTYQYYLTQDPNYKEGQNEVQEEPAEGNVLPGEFPPFSSQEETEIQRQFKNLNSPDFQVTSSAWNALAPYMKANPPLFRDRLAEALNRSNSRLFIVQAAWGLCIYYGEEGRQSVIRLAVNRKEDPSTLYAIDDALKTLGKKDKEEIRGRVRQALEDARSPYAERFSR